MEKNLSMKDSLVPKSELQGGRGDFSISYMVIMEGLWWNDIWMRNADI